MRKVAWKRILPLALAAAFLCGCSIGQKGTKQTMAPELLQQTQDETSISFSWWGNDPRHQYTLSGLRIFEEKNPDIRVKHSYGVWDGYETRNRVFMKSHTNADVMQINYSWLSSYSPDGTGYYDLRTLGDVLDLSSYTEQDLALCTVNGHLNALSIAYNMPVFFYNKDIYDRYGLSIPKTWEELFAAADVMSKDGIYPIGMVKKHMFLSVIAWFEQKTGRTIYTADGTYCGTVEDWKEMLTFYRELIDRKVIPEVTDFGATDFTSGHTAGAVCWASDASRYSSSLTEAGANVVLGDNLKSTDALRSGWYMKPATLYAISATTQHPKEAARLLDFLLNDADMAKLQGTEKGVPIASSALEALQSAHMLDSLEYEASQQIREMQGEIEVMPTALEASELTDGFKTTADKFLYNRADLDTCAQEIHEALEENG